MKQRGLALISTIWILAVLAILTWSFALMVRTDTQITMNYTDGVKSRYLAQAGIHRIAAEIPLTLEPFYLGDQPYVNTDAIADQIGFAQGSYEIELVDETSKINVNQATTSMLTALFGDSEVAQSIRDWMDADDNPRQLGAESDYYLSLSTPYYCRNAPLTTVDELMLVKGVTPELLLSTGEELEELGLGSSESSTTTTTSTPMTSTLIETGETLSLRDLLTVYTDEPNVDATGNPRVNIASASANQLRRALRNELSRRDIEAIVSWRDGSGGTGGGGGRPGGGGFPGGGLPLR